MEFIILLVRRYFLIFEKLYRVRIETAVGTSRLRVYRQTTRTRNSWTGCYMFWIFQTHVDFSSGKRFLDDNV